MALHLLRNAAPVTWHCTCYVTLHLLRGAAPVTWRCTRSERVQCLRIGCSAPKHEHRNEIHTNTKRHDTNSVRIQRTIPDRGHSQTRDHTEDATIHIARNTVLGTHHCIPSGRRAAQGHTDTHQHTARRTHHGALHPLRGAAPVAWRCTRYVALHLLRNAAPDQNGCNAYGSGAAPPRVVHYHYTSSQKALVWWRCRCGGCRRVARPGCGARRRWLGAAAVPVGGGGAWPGFETTRRAKLAARTASGRATAHRHTKQPRHQPRLNRGSADAPGGTVADGERAGHRPQAHQAAPPSASAQPRISQHSRRHRRGRQRR